MKVRIGNIWFDSEEIPIMVMFDSNERKIMKSKYGNFASFPQNLIDKKIKIDFVNGEIIKY